MIKGIDISEMNGVIDFEKVKKSGIDFVIIRASFGRKKEDKLLHRNAKACIRNKIPIGFYYYSYAVDEETAREEALFFLKSIKDYKDHIKYPLIIDMEDSDGYKKEKNAISKENLTNIVKVATDVIRNQGFIPMVYANKDYFDNYLDEEELKNVPKWIAWWNEKAQIDKSKYTIWQYKSTGIVEGIGTKVDMNESFFDYEKYTNYLQNIIKINEIKLKTGLQDITIQFLSCYKWGQELIDKIYERINGKKLKLQDNYEIGTKKIVVQEEYKIEKKTIDFMSNYIYEEELFSKLFKAICEENEK